MKNNNIPNINNSFRLSKYRSGVEEDFRLPELKSIDEYRRYSFEDYLNDNDYNIDSLENGILNKLLEHFYECIANDQYNSYEGVVQPYLYEGLITSYDPFAFSKHIEKTYLDKGVLKAYVEKHTLKIIVDCRKEDENKIIELLSRDANVYGYYCASFGIDKETKTYHLYVMKQNMIWLNILKAYIMKVV